MKIGLTGGIGCGKSTVAELFADAGWSTIQSDAVARDILCNDEAVLSALRERWGDAVFTVAGVVDRQGIADRVFSDTEALRWLEALLHPKVRAHWEQQIDTRPEVNWLVEIPLLFEKSLETRFDFTVCVSCPPDLVTKRMVSRGYTEAQVERRRERQMSLDAKIDLADFVISNAGSLEFLKRQTTRLIEQLGR